MNNDQHLRLQMKDRLISELQEHAEKMISGMELLEHQCDDLKKQVKRLEHFKQAYMEWSDKTEWVQNDSRFHVLLPWGKHRADVLKEYIERLEKNLSNTFSIEE